MSDCAECSAAAAQVPRDSPKAALAELFRELGPSYAQRHRQSPQQSKALRDMAGCRTAALGGHVDCCTRCGHESVAFNSCRNRHCPTCQGAAQHQWIAGRLARVLPTHYFHVVLTLPHELGPLAQESPAAVYDLLLRAATATLLDLGRDPQRLGAQLGVTVVLHTWARDLTLHPHVHCIVTGGGLSRDGARWVSTRPRFLFPHKVLAALFRGKVLAGLDRLWTAGRLNLRHRSVSHLAHPARWSELQDPLRRKPWVAFAKRPFAGPAQVITYLGQYTHRVAISNRRILSADQHRVRFRTRGNNQVELTTDDFIRRFLLHVLPHGFVKIRHAGLNASRHVDTQLATARELLAPALPQTPEQPDDIHSCREPTSSASPTLPLSRELRCSNCGATAVIRIPFGRDPRPPIRAGP